RSRTRSARTLRSPARRRARAWARSLPPRPRPRLSRERPLRAPGRRPRLPRPYKSRRQDRPRRPGRSKTRAAPPTARSHGRATAGSSAAPTAPADAEKDAGAAPTAGERSAPALAFLTLADEERLGEGRPAPEVAKTRPAAPKLEAKAGEPVLGSFVLDLAAD